MLEINFPKVVCSLFYFLLYVAYILLFQFILFLFYFGWGCVFYTINSFSSDAGECSHGHQGLLAIPRQKTSKALVNSMLAPADLCHLFLARDQLCANFG